MMKSANQIKISNIPEFSAIYYAMLQYGYDYYSVERSLEHINIIKKFIGQKGIPNFFSDVRQNTCEVYPYWPRAAILETAVFYLHPNHLEFRNYDTLYRKIMCAGNILDNERNHSLWDWIDDFPTALNEILSSDGFHSYMEWENDWIKKLNITYRKELQLLQSCLQLCIKKYQSPVQEIQVVINPIKCVYSADFHLIGGRLVISSGWFRIEMVLHEFLHHVVHPFVPELREQILKHRTAYPKIDRSYYLSGDDKGHLNAFEEYAVRILTRDFMMQIYPENIFEYLRNLLL